MAAERDRQHSEQADAGRAEVEQNTANEGSEAGLVAASIAGERNFPGVGRPGASDDAFCSAFAVRSAKANGTPRRSNQRSRNAGWPVCGIGKLKTDRADMGVGHREGGKATDRAPRRREERCGNSGWTLYRVGGK
jgi:hypothetical protein